MRISDWSSDVCSSDLLSTDRARLFYHSSSYTANPIACAAANANLAIWDEEPVQARTDALAEAQAAHLSLLAGHPRVVNPRRLGTIAALEVAAPDSGYLSAQIGRATCRDRGCQGG